MPGTLYAPAVVKSTGDNVPDGGGNDLHPIGAASIQIKG
jgi:hypothetical protein